MVQLTPATVCATPGGEVAPMCPFRQVDVGRTGHRYGVDDNRRRPTSWLASLLPSMVLVALLTGGVASATNTSDDAPVLDMTVTTAR